jgi:hypothetical protein
MREHVWIRVYQCVCVGVELVSSVYNSLKVRLHKIRVTSHLWEVPDSKIWVQSKDDEAVRKLPGGSIWAIVFFVVLMVS